MLSTCILLLDLLVFGGALAMTSSGGSWGTSTSNQFQRVLVTGANGYLGSHIVQQLLTKGYVVHGTVRDVTSNERVDHLRSLPGASERLRLFTVGDLAQVTSEMFDEAMEGCTAVMHVATPINQKFKGEGNFDGERDIYNPAIKSTRELLNCIDGHLNTVQCLVLTSSMAAIAPDPEPAIKDESHWSDSGRQKSRGNWYGATKTDQEKMVQDWAEKLLLKTNDAAICPTMIIGPALNKSSDISGTMGSLRKWFLGQKHVAPNDSMSFIHVEDCAAMHIAAMQGFDIGDDSDSGSGSPKLKATSGKNTRRYMSLIESWHWNDIATCLKELYPDMPSMELYDGNDVIPVTQFNLNKMNSLGVNVRSMRETLEESLHYLRSVGAL